MIITQSNNFHTGLFVMMLLVVNMLSGVSRANDQTMGCPPISVNPALKWCYQIYDAASIITRVKTAELPRGTYYADMEACACWVEQYFYLSKPPFWGTISRIDAVPKIRNQHYLVAEETTDNVDCGNDWVGNPCVLSSGDKYQTEPDFKLDSVNLKFTRYYHSRKMGVGFKQLGNGWQHNYSARIDRHPVQSRSSGFYPRERSASYDFESAACTSGWLEIRDKAYSGKLKTYAATYSELNGCEVSRNGVAVARPKVHDSRYYTPPITTNYHTVSRPDGTIYTFKLSGTSWLAVGNAPVKLEKLALGWKFTDRDGMVEQFDEEGKLITTTNTRGLATTLVYDTNGNLDTVTGPFGQQLAFTYDDGPNIVNISTPLGNYVYGYKYVYDMAMLSSVTKPDGNSRQYLYEDPNFPGNLTGIVDERAIQYATWTYTPDGKVKSSEHATGVERIDIVYNLDGTRTVTDSRGAVRNYDYEMYNGILRLTDITGVRCKTCAVGSAKSLTYYDEGYVYTKTDWGGRIITYGNYDNTGQPGFKIVGYGTPLSHRTDYVYDTRFFNKPTSIIEPSVFALDSSVPCTLGVDCKVTTYTYNSMGNPTSKTISGFNQIGQVINRAVTYKYGGDGSPECALTPLNFLCQIDGPRPNTVVDDIVTLNYYPNEPLEANNRAKLSQLIGPENIILRDNIQYTLTGKVLSEQRPNGLNLSYTYFPGNDRLETLTETTATKTRVTRWTYLATGEVETVTQGYGTPLATSVTLGYDDARRLTSITDNLGNRIKYTLDTEGNLEKQDISNANLGILHQTLSQTFDIYNQLDTRTLVDEVTDFNFLANGTLDTTVDPNQITTKFTYDNLNRLTTITSDLNGLDPNTQNTLTQYQYDSVDNLTLVTNPNNSDTTYIYDDFGNFLKEVSPDRGDIRYDYDEVGNSISITDARGVTAVYTYDGLNRVVKIDYPGTTEDIVLTYDSGAQCENSVGRLCSSSDQSGLTEYSYDEFGNINRQRNSVLGVTYITQYTRNLLNQTTQTITPTGRIIAYGPNAIGQNEAIDAMVNGSLHTVLHNATYRANGQLSQQEFGNGFLEKRLYNLKAQITSLDLPALPGAALLLDANKDSITAYPFTQITIPVLANDAYNDIKNVAVTIKSVPTNATVTINLDGGINYLSNEGFVGSDSFRYQMRARKAEVQLSMWTWWTHIQIQMAMVYQTI